MADEISPTNVPADGSSAPKVPSPVPTSPTPHPEDEARIIDEIIVKPAKPAVAPASIVPPVIEKTSDLPKPSVLSPQPAPPASPPAFVSPLIPPQAPRVSVPTPAITPLAVPPAPVPLPVAQTPPPPRSGPQAPTPALPIPPAAPTPLPKPAPQTPRPASSLPEDVVEKERQDIANILAEAKIPERRPNTPATSESNGIVFDTKLGATATSLDEKKAETPAPQPQSTVLETYAISPLRTLKKDLQEIVQVKKISLVRAAALEQEKRRRTTSLESGAPAKGKRGFGFFLAIMLFIILGGGALLGVYVVMNATTNTPLATSDTILFAEGVVALPIQGETPLELKRLIAQARAGGGGTLGSITQIVPTVPELGPDGVPSERVAALDEFLRALGTRAPADLTRALSSEFFFGIHTVDKNAPLLVIPVLSYERAFAGMLSWEETMNADLAPAFTAVPVQVIGPGGLPQKRLFEDEVMRNYDVRALKDDAGEIQLYYSFPTRTLLVISESPYSFTEILSRLRAERKL